MRVSSSGTKNVGTKVPLASRRSEEHTSELQSRLHLVCRLLLEKKKRDLHLRKSRYCPVGRIRPARGPGRAHDLQTNTVSPRRLAEPPYSARASPGGARCVRQHH